MKLALSSLLATLALCMACDPEGPGARGEVRLGKGISTTGFTTLMVYAEPDEGFDPAKPDFPDVPQDPYDWIEVLPASDLAKQPVPYEVGEVVGTTPHEKWRVFAWLTNDDATDDELPVGPRKGEPYGTTTFKVDDCGVGFGDYCTVTGGVDVTIDKVAP